MPSLRHKRGTRAQIEAAALALGLKPGEVYLLSDEARLTVGTAVNAHEAAAKKSETDLITARLNVASGYASGNVAAYISGQYYDNSLHPATPAVLTGAANQTDLSPYYSNGDLTIDRIGCGVSTAVAGALFKIVIYGSNAAGWPDALLYESADLSAAAAAFSEATLSFTFAAGVRYWVGIRKSSTASFRTVPTSSCLNLGLLSNNATSYASILRRTLPYAAPAPANWGFVGADRAANITPPSIRFRAV
jgi:hypothetical protein